MGVSVAVSHGVGKAVSKIMGQIPNAVKIKYQSGIQGLLMMGMLYSGYSESFSLYNLVAKMLEVNNEPQILLDMATSRVVEMTDLLKTAKETHSKNERARAVMYWRGINVDEATFILAQQVIEADILELRKIIDEIDGSINGLRAQIETNKGFWNNIKSSFW